MTVTTFSYLLPPFTPSPELKADGDGNGPEFTYQADHVADALSLLLSQFDNSTDLRALLAALVRPTQELENAMATQYAAFDVDTAEGVLLDILGGIVGERRGGRLDSEYRAYVKARVAANASDGSAADIYRVARLILGDVTHDLRIQTLPPAHYRLTVSGAAAVFPWDTGVSSTIVARAITTLLTDATSLGVSFDVQYQATDDAHTFTLADADVYQADVLRGTADDSKTAGGFLSDLEGSP